MQFIGLGAKSLLITFSLSISVLADELPPTLNPVCTSHVILQDPDLARLLTNTALIPVNGRLKQQFFFDRMYQETAKRAVQRGVSPDVLEKNPFLRGKERQRNELIYLGEAFDFIFEWGQAYGIETNILNAWATSWVSTHDWNRILALDVAIYSPEPYQGPKSFLTVTKAPYPFKKLLLSGNGRVAAAWDESHPASIQFWNTENSEVSVVNFREKLQPPFLMDHTATRFISTTEDGAKVWDLRTLGSELKHQEIKLGFQQRAMAIAQDDISVVSAGSLERAPIIWSLPTNSTLDSLHSYEAPIKSNYPNGYPNATAIAISRSLVSIIFGHHQQVTLERPTGTVVYTHFSLGNLDYTIPGTFIGDPGSAFVLLNKNGNTTQAVQTGVHDYKRPPPVTHVNFPLLDVRRGHAVAGDAGVAVLFEDGTGHLKFHSATTGTELYAYRDLSYRQLSLPQISLDGKITVFRHNEERNTNFVVMNHNRSFSPPANASGLWKQVY